MGSDHARVFSSQAPGVKLQYFCDAEAVLPVAKLKLYEGRKS